MIRKTALASLLALAAVTMAVSAEMQTAKIVALKKHPEGRIISWVGNSPTFDRYPFYDLTLQYHGKKYTARYESMAGYFPNDWQVGKEVNVQHKRGEFTVFRGEEEVPLREVNAHDCVLTGAPTPGLLPQVPCD